MSRASQVPVALVTTDNVVYLSTYKMMKKVREEFIPYKNKYLSMSQEGRAAARQQVSAALAANPHHLMARIMSRAQQEVDNG